MITAHTTSDPDRTEFRHDADGFVVGITRASSAPGLVEATDVLGRRAELPAEMAEFWIRQQYETVGTVEMMDSARVRIGTSGELVGSLSSPELVARREKLRELVATMPADVSDRLDRAVRVLAEVPEGLDTAEPPPAAVRHRVEHLQRIRDRLRATLEARHRWIDEHSVELRELEAVKGQLLLRRMKRLDELGRGEVGRRVLGDPPGPGTASALEAAWNRAAEEYVSVEQRHGTVDLNDRQATRRLRYFTEQLQRSRQPQRDLGPTIHRA